MYKVKLPKDMTLLVELEGRDVHFEIVYPENGGTSEKLIFKKKASDEKGSVKPEGAGLTAEADVVRGGKKFKRVERSGDPETFVEYSDPDMP